MAGGTILPAAERMDQYLSLLQDKSIAIVANHTSLVGHTHLVDSLRKRKVYIKCIFAPEHGFRGQSGAGDKIKNGIDRQTGLKVVSLYGKHLKPDKEDLKDVQLVLFDIQDVGVRFYTFISTLQYVMEACSENNIPLIVLDRPNPNGFYIDGPVLDKKYISFIGMQPVPVVYGMTIGEYALMLNGEKWLKTPPCKLTVVPVANYTHDSIYRLPVAPSPNLKNMDAIYLYPSVCFFEGTKISLGRGTDKPFQLIGFPYYKHGEVLFTPKNISGVVSNPPYLDTLCSGLDLTGEGEKIRANQNQIQLHWLLHFYREFENPSYFFTNFFDLLAGTDELRKMVIAGKQEEEIRSAWKSDIESFRKIRKKYLLYD